MNIILLNNTYNDYVSVYNRYREFYRVMGVPFTRPYVVYFMPTNEVDYSTFLSTINSEIKGLFADFYETKARFI